MEPYIIWLVIAESVILVLVVAVLFHKYEELNKLHRKIGKTNDEQNPQKSYFDGNADYVPIFIHELRAPLSVVRGASDLILKEAASMDADQIHELLVQIRENSDTMLKTVADILDFSKIGSGKFEINVVYANINDVLKEEVASFQPIAKVKKIDLELNLNEDFGNFSFDPLRLKQVLNNLLTNAMKFTPEGGKVIISTGRYDHHASITVADTGIGIADADKERLFKPFSQASNHTKVRERGTGLGLVIVKAIVESHKGTIWLEDNKPQGTKFIFTLPL